MVNPLVDETKGPFVAVAALCENVIEDKHGVLSLIRVVDEFTITAQGPDVPDALPEGRLQVKLVISLKSGSAKGRHKLQIVPWLPSGQLGNPLATVPLNLDGGHRGQNVIMDLHYEVKDEGTHWLNVVLNDDQVLTRIPLHVKYQPMPTPR